MLLNNKAVFSGRDTKTASVCYTGCHVTLCYNFWIILLVLCLFVFGATAPPPSSGPGPPHSRGF